MLVFSSKIRFHGRGRSSTWHLESLWHERRSNFSSSSSNAPAVSVVDVGHRQTEHPRRNASAVSLPMVPARLQSIRRLLPSLFKGAFGQRKEEGKREGNASSRWHSSTASPRPEAALSPPSASTSRNRLVSVLRRITGNESLGVVGIIRRKKRSFGAQTTRRMPAQIQRSSMPLLWQKILLRG